MELNQDGISNDYYRYDFLCAFTKKHKINVNEQDSICGYLEHARQYRNYAVEIGIKIRAMEIDPLKEFKGFVMNQSDPLNFLSLAMQDWIVQETLDHSVVLKFPPSVRYRLEFCKDLCSWIEQTSKEIEIHERLLNETVDCLIKKDSEQDSMCFMSYTFIRDTEIDNRDIVLRAIPESEMGNTIGLKSWPASFLLADYLVENSDILVKDKRIIELGSGCGLVGSMLCKFFNFQSLIVSDFEESVNENLQFNINLNSIQSKNVKVLSIDWFECLNNPSILSKINVDVVIASDVIYSPDLIDPLLNVLHCLCLQNPSLYIVIANAKRNPETFESFISKCPSYLLKIQYMDSPKIQAFNWKSNITQNGCSLVLFSLKFSTN
jgi:predicted nicotinamide N-methyase